MALGTPWKSWIMLRPAWDPSSQSQGRVPRQGIASPPSFSGLEFMQQPAARLSRP